MKVPEGRISPTHHHNSNAAEIFRIYIRSSFKQSSRQAEKKVPHEVESSLVENKPSKNSILRLIRRTEQETTVKEKNLMQLQREETTLARHIKNLRRQLKVKNNSVHNTVVSTKPQTACEVRVENLANARTLPKRQEFQRLQNQSLYEKERQIHFEGLRRTESMMKSVLQEQRRVGLYSRQLQRNRISEQKLKTEQNHKMYRALMRIKQLKQREHECLKYEQISLQARLRSQQLQKRREQQLARISKLQEQKQNMERRVRADSQQ